MTERPRYPLPRLAAGERSVESSGVSAPTALIAAPPVARSAAVTGFFGITPPETEDSFERARFIDEPPPSLPSTATDAINECRREVRFDAPK